MEHTAKQKRRDDFPSEKLVAWPERSHTWGSGSGERRRKNCWERGWQRRLSWRRVGVDSGCAKR